MRSYAVTVFILPVLFLLQTIELISSGKIMLSVLPYFLDTETTVDIKLRAQLFESRLAPNPGINLTRVSFSCVEKHFLG